MAVSRVVLRFEAGLVVDQYLSMEADKAAEALGKEVERIIKNTPAPSTGQPLRLRNEPLAPLTVTEIALVDSDKAREKYPTAKAGMDVYVAMATIGLIFDDEYPQGDIEAVMQAIADDDAVAADDYPGLAWQFYSDELMDSIAG